MCGIAGTVIEGNDAESANLKMIDSMHHRGPDDKGLFVQKQGKTSISLASTRLAIIDLSNAGHQPMQDKDSGLVLAYNGEIFNYSILRRELSNLGELFQSDTDTEVVLKSYKKWGDKCLQRFRGMFSIAIWDPIRGELFLARDRFGIKPLYFSYLPSGFVFASEIRTILASGLVEPYLDSLGLEIFLANGFLVSPSTIINNIYSLMPGHFLTVDANGRKRRFEEFHSLAHITQSKSTERESFDSIITTFNESVEMRLISDAPLGAFLSGGLDSSAIVASMAQASKNVRSISISFDEEKFDESFYAGWVADRFKTKHIDFRLTYQHFYRWMDDALNALDQPSFDGINAYFVARLASENGLRVALSGLGGDELFGGYPFFRQIGAIARIGPLLGRAGGLFHYLSKRNIYNISGLWKLSDFYAPMNKSMTRLDVIINAYQAVQGIFPSWTRSYLRLENIKSCFESTYNGLPAQFVTRMQSEIVGDDINNAISKIAIRLFLGERCLRDTDSMTMAVSLEARAPMTDHYFVECCLSFPSPIRLEGTPNKSFQWRIFQSLLGSDFPLRKKQGFVFPFEEWLRKPEGMDRINGTLRDYRACEQAGLSPESTRIILNRFSSKQAVPWSRIWALYVLVKWCINNKVTWRGL